MVLIGLSIFIASISLLCLRHFPRAWFFRDRPRSGKNDTADFHNHNKDVTKMIEHEKDKTLEQDLNLNLSRKSVGNQFESDKDTKLKRNEDSDIKAMPPPPLPPKRNTSLSTNNSSIESRNSNSAPKLDSHLSIHDKNNQNQPNFLAPVPPSKGNAISNGKPLFLLKPPSVSSYSSLPNRIPNGLSSTAVSSTSQAKSNKKVMLKPGHSPLDWARLSTSSVNLSGLPPGAPYIKVPPSLLKQYTGRKGKDAWTVLGNKVYNITPYLPFHPGGEPELLRSAGRDGTKLFTEAHPWVNWEGMLSACFVGIAVEENEVYDESSMHEMD